MATEHVIERAFKRHGLVLTPADVSAIEAAIRGRMATARRVGPMGYAKRGGKNDEKWIVTHAGAELKVVWSVDLGRIMTVLPVTCAWEFKLADTTRK